MSTEEPFSPQPNSAIPAQPHNERNVIGLISLVVAVVGFIFACVPGALIVGWILLPIAFILALVSLFQRGKSKKSGIAALIVSVVGTIVAFLVFFVVVGSAVNDAFGGGDVAVETPSDSDSTDEAEQQGPQAEESGGSEGTRANPYPIGSTITTDDWAIVVEKVTLDATEQVARENEFNDPPQDGTQYMLVNVTATYQGDDPDGETPWLDIDYVTSGGNTISSSDSMAVAPDAFDQFKTLYDGASTSGNVVFEVPSDTAGDGTLAVRPDMFGDKVFVAVR